MHVKCSEDENDSKGKWQAAVRIGDAQIERGETVPYTTALMAQISQRAVERAKQGEKINNPDALP